MRGRDKIIVIFLLQKFLSKKLKEINWKTKILENRHIVPSQNN